ncbi:hypothetical protein [Kibdelosporangium phytohabitans]|uniref:hypothetical protein n=1 Tax=Kibdelosporangium phytohabitans TaxID=860235 RepID=UPI0012FBD72A|nr:hypothetical protein [Kibdelosporangium phytohabitans]MBE1471424.1 hypothetical protein [Kibdelosporangium phytohabitans]
MSTDPVEPHADQPVPPPPNDAGDGFEREYTPEGSGMCPTPPMAAESDMVIRPRRK